LRKEADRSKKQTEKDAKKDKKGLLKEADKVNKVSGK
jgi:hypothetical protein